MSKIISISLTPEEKNLLDDMELSPTGIFKQKLNEIRENSINYNKKLENALKTIELMRKNLESVFSFIHDKQLFDDFQQYEKKNQM